MVCSLGMTSGRGRPGRRLRARRRPRRACWPACAPIRPRRRHRRIDVPHRARRRLRPRPHRALHRPRHRRRSGAHRRREVVLLEHRRRGDRDAGPPRGRARRVRPGSGSTSFHGTLDDGRRNNISMRRLKHEARDQERPDRRGRVPRRARLRAAAAAGPTRWRGSPTPAGLNRMMEMVNGSRFGVAMMGLGIARRSFLEAVIWAHHRRAKGRLLVDLPLAREQLVDMHWSSSRRRSHSASSAPPPSGATTAARLRRILVPAAKVRLCRLGVEAVVVRGRAARRQRLLRGLGPHPAAARRPVPSDLGGQREHLRPRRAAGDPP